MSRDNTHRIAKVNTPRIEPLCIATGMDQRDEKAARLRKAREKAGYANAVAAARAFGWGEAGYRHHENGTRTFDVESATKYGRAFKVAPGWLMLLDGHDNPSPIIANAQSVREIPLLGSVPGGNWREAVRRSSDTVPVPSSDAPRDAYALTVDGDSMDRHVPDGFTIVVDPNDLDLFPGRLFVVMNEDGETTFKEYRDGPARLVPASSNPAHKEIPVSGGGFRVLGRVVWGGKRLA